jgi:hypothetical protein
VDAIDLEYSAALREAYHQFDWGTDVRAVENAIETLRAFDPNHGLIRPLQVRASRLMISDRRRKLARAAGQEPTARTGVVLPFSWPK